MIGAKSIPNDNAHFFFHTSKSYGSKVQTVQVHTFISLSGSFFSLSFLLVFVVVIRVNSSVWYVYWFTATAVVVMVVVVVVVVVRDYCNIFFFSCALLTNLTFANALQLFRRMCNNVANCNTHCSFAHKIQQQQQQQQHARDILRFKFLFARSLSAVDCTMGYLVCEYELFYSRQLFSRTILNN